MSEPFVRLAIKNAPRERRVKIHMLSAQGVFGIGVVRDVLTAMDAYATITSVSEGVHSGKSCHYRGDAFDIGRVRMWHEESRDWEEIAGEALQRFCQCLRDALGPDWDVIIEADHMHVEWDAKEGPR